MTMTMPGLNVREVTDVDRRTARRLGMDPESVNLVINTWAEEYLTYERDQSKVSEMANGSKAEAAKAERAARGPARKASPAKATRAPRKAAAKPAGTPDQTGTEQTGTEAMTTAEAEARAGDGS